MGRIVKNGVEYGRGGNDLLNLIYPIGIEVDFGVEGKDFDPNVTWAPQKWKKIEDGRVNIAANSTYTVGSQGGEAEHALTVAELASHTHQQRFGNKSGHNQSPIRYIQYEEDIYGTTWVDDTVNMESGYTGDGNAHNNMQPYTAVNRWRRIR